MNVFAAVLAAGESRRFGATKLLQPWGDLPLVRHAVQQAEAACGPRTLLVVGHEGGAVASAAMPHSGFVACNERYAEGIGTSIATAARTLARSADGLLILLADQPLVTGDHLRALVDRWGGGDAITASAYAGVLGPPAVFPRSTFLPLASLTGDRGARSIIEGGRFPVQSLPCDAAAFDIDTPDDLEQRSQLTQPESPST
jgi:CTP:molybdopterin cytidylyltransferase MocA